MGTSDSTKLYRALEQVSQKGEIENATHWTTGTYLETPVRLTSARIDRHSICVH
jgi:hypothetical protein